MSNVTRLFAIIVENNPIFPRIRIEFYGLAMHRRRGLSRSKSPVVAARQQPVTIRVFPKLVRTARPHASGDSSGGVETPAAALVPRRTAIIHVRIACTIIKNI